jgi:dipeptidyl aminopeptidase/acylaminoacyl peptidase
MRERTATLIDIFASLSKPTEFSLSPDGSTVVFVREVGGYSQLFAMPVEHPGWPRQLTAGLADCTDPHWSPDGARLVFVRDDALWTIKADGTDARELVDHPAGHFEPRWSPDGSRIAFLSRRRGWSHIWTIAPDGSGLRQVTRGEFDASDFTWSADARWIAFSSIREQDLLTRGVYLVPSEGGAEMQISPRGYWSGAPSFSVDGRTLAYLSDDDGWFHIYLYDLQTHTTRQLTHGEEEDGGPHFYDVDPHGGPMFSPDGTHVAFIRHREGKFDLWVSDVTAGDARRISSNDGQYRIVGWHADSRRIAATFNSRSILSDLWLVALDGTARRLTDLSIGELNSMMAPDWMAYPARDGLTIHAALFRPGGDRADKSPAVVFVHGGPNFEFGEFYYPLPQILVHEGYVVLAPNYRGSTGYGTAFRNANFREWGHADAFDVIDAARWLQTQDFVDPGRIAVVGPSYGGYLTLCAITLEPELFCAAVDLFGDSDIAESYYHGERYGRLDLKRQMGTPTENPEGYRRGSPIHRTERIQAPLLILHGKDDMLVVPLMSEKMIEAMKIEEKYVESHFYEGEEHGFEKPENKKDAWERIVKFLNRYCKDEKEK